VYLRFSPGLLPAFALLAFVGMSSHSAVAQSEAQWAEIKAMNWRDATSVPLNMAQATVRLPDFQFITTDEARRYRNIVDGNAPVNLEAVALHLDPWSEIIFMWSDSGHVTMDDWADLDADALIAQIRTSTSEANKDRVSAGMSTITTVDWLQKPMLNRGLQTVFLTTDGTDSTGEHHINAIALKLGRTGYQRIVWIASPEQYKSQENLLLTATSNHWYQPGARYTDFVEGTDRTAGYGVAALVAGTLGVKLVKSGALAVGLAVAIGVLKKGGFLLLVMPFIGLFSWLRRRR
jgi:uncharacterized membrane-anchored protein